ncbi:MAG TPA: four helix bundle protein [Thermodesulfobacteriota bacterium]|nr:four helix bundle protein [Thermodesulfobacteriota bacterium]
MTHKDLDIWKLGMELVEKVYKMTAEYPKEEIYGLTNQMRRASVSIPSDISEGTARSSKKEYIQFLYVALGSLAELETQTIISEKLGYLKKDELMELIEKQRRKQLNFIKYLKGVEE